MTTTASSTIASVSASAAREIARDVDLTTGDIEHGGDVHVQGSVGDRRTINAAGSVLIDGVSAALRVEAGGKLRIAGGIKGGDQSRYRAGGDIHARYVANATVEAGGNTVLLTEAISSRLICSGRLIIRDGALVAGHTTATGGIRCRSLGAPTEGTRTVIEVGIDAAFAATAAQAVRDLEHRIARSVKIRQTITPLMNNQKSLNAQQKEQATELLFEAGELEAQTREECARFAGQLASLDARSNPRVRVMDRVNPPVTIRMPGIEADIVDVIEGPVWIVMRGIGRGRYIAVVQGGAIIAALPTRSVPDKPMEMLARLVAAHAPDCPES